MELFYGNEVLQWKCNGCFKLASEEVSVGFSN